MHAANSNALPPFDPRNESRPATRALHTICRLFGRVYHELDVVLPCRLPRTGPAILVCNHTSGLDPLLIQSVCPRMIVWMMAKEFYDQPLMQWCFKQIDAIPVARSGRDMAATREALRALKAGRVLGIFPEGKIEPARELLPFQTGVALLASKVNADIFPVYLDGSMRRKEMIPAVLTSQRARISFGPVVGCDLTNRSREGLDEATRCIQQAVQSLADAGHK